ncbi:MAG: hypothetical protein LBJ19_01195 [Holosporaceae bacterium]|jgi:hypothetical protein|nr:hypothetical protein [Holosporaceae bacterium]
MYARIIKNNTNPQVVDMLKAGSCNKVRSCRRNMIDIMAICLALILPVYGVQSMTYDTLGERARNYNAWKKYYPFPTPVVIRNKHSQNQTPSLYADFDASAFLPCPDSQSEINSDRFCETWGSDRVSEAIRRCREEDTTRLEQGPTGLEDKNDTEIGTETDQDKVERSSAVPAVLEENTPCRPTRELKQGFSENRQALAVCELEHSGGIANVELVAKEKTGWTGDSLPIRNCEECVRTVCTPYRISNIIAKKRVSTNYVNLSVFELPGMLPYKGSFAIINRLKPLHRKKNCGSVRARRAGATGSSLEIIGRPIMLTKRTGIWPREASK